LCLLARVRRSLAPLAWLWAYSKPVLYKLAYGTDRVPHGHEEKPPTTDQDEARELKQLRERIAELETKQATKKAAEGAKD
jgi:hypothetical protein